MYQGLLLLEIIEASTVWAAGFRLLYAVYIVERLFQDLVSRRCRFHIVRFDQNEDLCIPTNAEPTDYLKYALARSIIFKHFKHNFNSSSGVTIEQACHS
jgi:hypothetical protein